MSLLDKNESDGVYAESCPKCDSIELESTLHESYKDPLTPKKESRNGTQVVCKSCGFGGPIKPSLEKAVDGWNSIVAVFDDSYVWFSIFEQSVEKKETTNNRLSRFSTQREFQRLFKKLRPHHSKGDVVVEAEIGSALDPNIVMKVENFIEGRPTWQPYEVIISKEYIYSIEDELNKPFREELHSDLPLSKTA